jgi:hypothetical protein
MFCYRIFLTETALDFDTNQNDMIVSCVFCCTKGYDSAHLGT